MNVFAMIIAVCVQHAAGFEVTVHVTSESGNKSVEIEIKESGELISDFRKKIQEKAELASDNLLIRIGKVMKFDIDRITKDDLGKKIEASHQYLPTQLSEWFKKPTKCVQELAFGGAGEFIFKAIPKRGQELLVCYKVEEGSPKMELMKNGRVSQWTYDAEFAEKYYFDFYMETIPDGKGDQLHLKVFNHNRFDKDLESLSIAPLFAELQLIKFITVENENIQRMHARSRADLADQRLASNPSSVLQPGSPKSTADLEATQSLSSQRERMYARSREELTGDQSASNPSSVSQCGPSIIAAIVVVAFVFLMN